MSKKKVIEYNGKLSEINPNPKSNDNDLGGSSQHSNPNPINDSKNDRDSNLTNENQGETINDMDNHPDINDNSPDFHPNDETGDISAKDFDLDDTSVNDDSELDNDSPNIENEGQEEPNSKQDGREDNENSDLHNNEKEGDNEFPSDLHNSDKNNEEPQENGIGQKDKSNLDNGIDDYSNKDKSLNDENDIKEESDLDFDNEKNSEGIKEKALDSINPNLSKGLKLKELSKMNKEEAAEQLANTAKSMAKKKIAESIAAYISPILLPLILIIFGILLIVIIILTMIAQNNQNEQTNKEGCSVTDKASTNIKDSKDATKNAINIYKYTKKNVKGSTNKGIAAWLGNIYVESGQTFSSKTIQGGAKYKESIAKDPNAGGYAFGFAQLDSDRRVNLLKYADKKNKKWSDMDLQLDYILNHDGTDSPLIKKLIKKDSDIKGITENIMNQWERAGAKDSLSERQAAASKYYSKIAKVDTGDSNISDSTSSASDNSDAGANSGCNNDSNSKVDGELGDSTKANGKKGQIIKQWKSKDDIPKKYRKYIKLPDFKGKYLNTSKNPFQNGGLRGQCTELTFNYMSELYKGDQPTNGNGNQIYNAYKQKGATITSKPTVGYGFSADPPYAGAATSAGHTGVVIGVMKDGKFLITNYNLNGEANKDQSRVETFALVDGNTKNGGIHFFSGVGGAKIKSKK